MVYVTGDMHGEIKCFKCRKLRKLKKGDTLIVCGDFGFVFNGSKKEARMLKWIGRRRYNVVFIEGVHDNLNLINEYKTEDWNGGMTHSISGRLRHLCRGHIFNIDGFSLFAFGGGEMPIMLESLSWSECLMPTAKEREAARERLSANGNKVDYVITHQCGRRLKNMLIMHEGDVNVLDAFLDEVRENVRYKGWMFAGYHIDRVIPPFDVILFDEVVKLGSPIEMRNKNTTKRFRAF